MLCTKCKEYPASFFYTQSVNGKETSVALCKHCAAKANISLGSSFIAPFFEKEQKKDYQKKCSLCALTFNDILKMGKVGCPKCYDTFKDELNGTIRSIHGSAKHVGQVPIHCAEKPTEEEILRDKLEFAIKNENYEEAAVLRDKIKELKGENNG